MLIGGNNRLTELINMTFKAVKITPGKAMNQARLYFGITYDKVKKEVYVFGGNIEGHDLAHSEKYSVERNKWTVLKPMNQYKSGAAATIINSQTIYVVGGINSSHNPQYFYNDIEKYYIGLNQWEVIRIVKNI